MSDENGVFEELNKLLNGIIKSASFESSCFGFPNDRIEVKSVHFGDDRTGRVGDVMHPTDYVRNITRLHHQSWILIPAQKAKKILQDNQELFGALDSFARDMDKLDQQIQGIQASSRKGSL